MDEQMKKGGLNTNIGRPIYGVAAGGKEMLMAELMLGEIMRWN
jgi:hypothetical protein